MKKIIKTILSTALCIIMLLGSVAVGGAGASDLLASVSSAVSADAYSPEKIQCIEGIPEAEKTETAKASEADDLPEAGSYDEKTVLVKCEAFDENMLGTLEYDRCERLYPNSKWYKITLANGEAVSAVEYLKGTGLFESVEYDYIMKSDATVSSVDVSSNPDSATQTYLETHGIKDLWNYQSEHGSTAGGNSDIIVAVIDSGVDYNHPDLKNNIWVNSAEIPDNGIDDDNNGYVDDYYGWDFVGNDNNPMDDNGHGTHVAGIIAAENNNIGSVGVAFNCKVMCLKAAQSSGYLNNSDIAEAVQYAYMNGASVINMSFGGSSVSLVTEEALESAYNQCVLVASAGNDCLCNWYDCEMHEAIPFYPAAFTYVIGVMSCDASGNYVSSFSNFDHYPYNNTEYELYACGEGIPSTWPNGKYSVLSGTSMAAPVISGIAALLRSTWTDRNVYSSKYIQSQLVNTGTIHPYDPGRGTDFDHIVVNGYNAIRILPKPNIYALDYYTFDGENISSANNNNGVVEAGETVHLALEMLNYGGVASNVTVTVDTHPHGDASLSDPYVTIINDMVNYSDIGTYSRRTGKKIYTDGNLTDIENSFTLNIADNCPNNYYVKINVVIEYSNGLDSGDITRYRTEDTIMLVCFNGIELPEIINEDTVFEANRHYLLPHDMIIPSGVTVTFEEGCEIEYYGYKTGYDSGFYDGPQIDVYGTLNFNGTKDNMIKIYPSEEYSYYVCNFYYRYQAHINFSFVDANNLNFNGALSSSYDYYPYYITFKNCKLTDNGTNKDAGLAEIEHGNRRPTEIGLYAESIEKCYIDYRNQCRECAIHNAENSYFSVSVIHCDGSFRNNIVTEYLGRNEYCNILGLSFDCPTKDNIFTSQDEGNYIWRIPRIGFDTDYEHNDMYLGGYKKQAPSAIWSYIDSSGKPIVDINYEITDYSNILPFIRDIIITDKDGNRVLTVGSEEVNVKVVFSRPMDTSRSPMLFFGSREPYADYEIKGGYVSSTIWEGTYTLKAQIENGVQKFSISNAYSADGYELVDTIYLFRFDIDTTSAQSMNISAKDVNNGIKLEWIQDDYVTLMGYNVYRSEEKDGDFTRINSAVIPGNENSFVDETIEQEKQYWYTFTVVLSDMTESGPAGKTSCTASDTIAPVISHTPVNQGYLNRNLNISCNATDNVSVDTVTLYYRTTGSDSWKYLSMMKQGDKYSATVFGSEVTLAGLQYYIVASDGVNSANRGSADNPYSVNVTDPNHTHSYSGVVTAPTCTEEGYTTYTCSCGDSYVADKKSALGHSFTNYKYNNDATTEKDGTETAKCDRCTATDTRTAVGTRIIPGSYVLTYDANGGIGAPGRQNGNGNVTLSSTRPTKDGYNFLGWAESASAASAKYQPGEIFNITNDITLYAVWQKKEEPTDPSNPDNPEKPSNPDTPENPGNQDNPTNPNNPDNPGNTLANAKLYVRSSATVDYRSNVTITAIATGVPEGYVLAIYNEEGEIIAIGDNTKVSYTVSQMTSNNLFTVFVIDQSTNSVQKDSNGAELCKDCIVVVKTGFFDKLIAFFKALFGALPKVEIKP